MRIFGVVALMVAMFWSVSWAQETGVPPEQSSGQVTRRPVRISGGVMAGQIQTKVDPVYPATAKEQGIMGAVVLYAMIGKDGKVETLNVISGPEMLRAAALDAVRQWIYRPYLLNGEPVEVDTTVTVNFSLGTLPNPQ